MPICLPKYLRGAGDTLHKPPSAVKRGSCGVRTRNSREERDASNCECPWQGAQRLQLDTAGTGDRAGRGLAAGTGDRPAPGPEAPGCGHQGFRGSALQGKGLGAAVHGAREEGRPRGLSLGAGVVGGAEAGGQGRHRPENTEALPNLQPQLRGQQSLDAATSAPLGSTCS